MPLLRFLCTRWQLQYTYMAAGKYNDFTLDKTLPIKQLVKGLEPMFPVGLRGMEIHEPNGEDEKGQPKMKVTSLQSVQGAHCAVGFTRGSSCVRTCFNEVFAICNGA
eukprot:6193074-Pleurochrysis_carterae.AAC.6